LVATDLSEAMLFYARSKVGGVIEWRAADAGRLPFADAEFGIAVCAFGVMFFPDKKAAFREARRVLREGGGFYFNVWDGLHGNPHARVAADFLASLFPGDPAMKFGSMPYAFNDEALIRQMLGDARFGHIRTERVSFACSCPSAKEWATGQIRGTPRGLLLQERGLSLDEVIDRLAQTMARVGGTAPFEYTPQALLIEARSV
jgi:SAM-dependent methyltransferase